MKEKTDYPSILETNIFFMIIAFLLISIGAKAQKTNLHMGLLITEYLIIMLPTVTYLKLRGYTLKKTLKLNPINFKDIIVIILIIISSYPVAVFFNYIGFIFLHFFAEIKPSPIPIPATSIEFIISFLIIALTPGICEEIMFRGFILNAYKDFGKKKAIIYSAILFGIFHFNVQNLLGPIYLGIILGVIFLKTNSLYSSIIGHTANNTIALIIGYSFSNSNGVEEINVNVDQMNMLGAEELLISLIGLGIIALSFGFLSYKLIKLLNTGYEKDLVEINNFLPKEELIDKLYQRDNLNGYEILPIIVVVVIFILLNYLYFFL